MSKEQLEYAEVVILHSGGVDPSKVAMEAGIPLPHSIRSFTDTHPENNPYNTGLWEAAGKSDYLLIENELYVNDTVAAREALSSQSIRAKTHTAQTFKVGAGIVDVLVVTGIEAPMGSNMEVIK